MKKLLAVILVLAMMLALCACGNTGTTNDVPAENNSNSDNNNDNNTNNNNESQKPVENIAAGGMTLAEIGTVPDGVQFTSGGIVSNYKNEKVKILNQNGVAFNDTWYDDINSIISDGVCIVSNTDANGKELLGIVDSIAEKELVPCEAVEVVKLSDRFLLLGYETEKGTKEDGFGYYFVDSNMTYYKGYGKILDLETGKIISGLEIKTSKSDVSAAGNLIFVKKDHPSSDVYAADGKLLGSYDYIYAYPDSGIVLQSTTKGVCVYDKDLKLVSTLVTTDTLETYKPIEGSNEMLLHEYTKDGTRRYCVTDLSGKALTAEYSRIVTVFPSGYLHITENSVSRVVDFKGNDIVPACYSVHYAEPGYFVAKVQNEGYYVYDKTGKKINQTAMKDCSNGLILKNNDGKLLVLSTGELLEVKGYAKVQIGSLVLVESTLYDVISGKAVFTDVDSCVSTGDSLYIWDNDKENYTRYIAEFKSES